jgi:cyclopropane-fatty-acyl-phospholipid synthase
VFSGRIQEQIAELGRSSHTCFQVRFADGAVYRSLDGSPQFTVVIRHRRAYRRIALFGHIGLLESYFDGDIDVEGDFGSAFRVGLEGRLANQPNFLVRLRNSWHEWRFSNRSFAQAKANARFHYGLGYEFYRQWLDWPLMMYTCAYWKEGTTSVEQAQANKIDHVCRKIRLAAGETVIDIGTGFGGFLFHALERYGAVPTGTNTTTEQVEWLRGEVARRGVQDKITLIEADFRQVHAQFDKVVSIGVLEHAGRDQLAEVIRAHAEFLKPGGLGMLHFIGHVGVRDTEFYIRKHVFPGGWIPSLAQTISLMEACGLEVVDVENLRRHYALTLDAWAERFERNWDAIHRLDPARFNDRFRRIWRTYLVSCAEMFRSPTSSTYLFQIVFSKPNISRDNYPMSRAFLYQ